MDEFQDSDRNSGSDATDEKDVDFEDKTDQIDIQKIEDPLNENDSKGAKPMVKVDEGFHKVNLTEGKSK